MAKILVIDDSEFSLNITKKILSSIGHQVVGVNNGTMGVEILAKQSFDCICVDLLMPEMDGYEVIKRIAAISTSLPVIVITADIQETARQRCLELGAREVISKPATKDKLVSIVDKILSPGK